MNQLKEYSETLVSEKRNGNLSRRQIANFIFYWENKINCFVDPEQFMEIIKQFKIHQIKSFEIKIPDECFVLNSNIYIPFYYVNHDFDMNNTLAVLVGRPIPQSKLKIQKAYIDQYKSSKKSV